MNIRKHTKSMITSPNTPNTLFFLNIAFVPLYQSVWYSLVLQIFTDRSREKKIGEKCIMNCAFPKITWSCLLEARLWTQDMKADASFFPERGEGRKNVLRKMIFFPPVLFIWFQGSVFFFRITLHFYLYCNDFAIFYEWNCCDHSNAISFLPVPLNESFLMAVRKV